jgi:hypothetical protein
MPAPRGLPSAGAFPHGGGLLGALPAGMIAGRQASLSAPGPQRRGCRGRRDYAGAEPGRAIGPAAVTDLVTAGRALGLGRTKSYELACAGQFPCPVIRAGTTWLVPTAGLLGLLGLPVPRSSGPGDKNSSQDQPGTGNPAVTYR